MNGQIYHESLSRCYEEEYESLFDFIDNLPDNRIIEQINEVLSGIIRGIEKINTSDNVIETHTKRIYTYPNLNDVKHLNAVCDGKHISVTLLDNNAVLLREEHADYSDMEKMYLREIYDKIYINNRIIYQSSAVFWYGPKLWHDETNVNVVKRYLISNDQMLIEDLVIWADGKVAINYYFSDYYVTDFVHIKQKREKLTEFKFRKESKEIRKKITGIYSNYDSFEKERAKRETLKFNKDFNQKVIRLMQERGDTENDNI